MSITTKLLLIINCCNCHPCPRNGAFSIKEAANYVRPKDGYGLGLWCLTPFSTIFQLYRGGHGRFISGEYRSTQKKTMDLPQITDKLYQIKLYRAGF